MKLKFEDKDLQPSLATKLRRSGRYMYNHMKTLPMLTRLLALGIVAIVLISGMAVGHSIVTTLSSSTNKSPLSQNQVPMGPLSASGPNLVDSSGKTVLLRGAMIESPFAYINGYISQHKNPLDVLTGKTFQAMQAWGMNAVRINISQWIQQADQSGQYLPRLDTAIANANQAGQYVILDFHDDKQSGSPYGDAELHSVSLAWWKNIADRYKDNPMMMYDVINEPGYTSWTQWAHGDSSHVGELDAYSAIRSAGSKQIVIFEPGGGANGTGKGWAGFPLTLLTGMSNVMFSKHVYRSLINSTPATLDAEWGTVLNKYPMFYGEWGLLPVQDSQCNGLTPNNADNITNTFLAYTKSRNVSWTAYAFERNYLIQDPASFQPTDFNGNWTCGTSLAHTKGMGQDVKNYLAANPNPGGGTVPTVSLAAAPTAVHSGSSSTLTWHSANATSCSAAGSWNGDKPLSGTSSTGALTASSTYALTCTGAGGSSSASASVTVNGNPPPPPPATREVIVKDTFQRPNQDGWGGASDGINSWTSDRTTPRIRISGHTGLMTAGGDSYNLLVGPKNAANVDDILYGHMAPLSSSNRFGLLLRYQDSNNWYYAYLDGNQLHIQRRLKGVFSVLKAAPFNFKANDPVELRFKAIGTTLQAKAWLNNQVEPSTWNVQVDDASFRQGQAGIRMNVSVGAGTITFFQANKFN